MRILSRVTLSLLSEKRPHKFRERTTRREATKLACSPTRAKHTVLQLHLPISLFTLPQAARRTVAHAMNAAAAAAAAAVLSTRPAAQHRG